VLHESTGEREARKKENAAHQDTKKKSGDQKKEGTSACSTSAPQAEGTNQMEISAQRCPGCRNNDNCGEGKLLALKKETPAGGSLQRGFCWALMKARERVFHLCVKNCGGLPLGEKKRRGSQNLYTKSVRKWPSLLGPGRRDR